MPQHAQNTTLLILGAGGRLGHLLHAAWQGQPPPQGTILHYQSRRALPFANSHCWSPGQHDTNPLPPCDVVIALWGATSGDGAAMAANVSLAHETRRVARACHARLAIHLSSAAVYGPALSATETTPPAPVTAYGQSKWQMEQTVAGFADPGCRHLCLRLANVVGADSLAPALSAEGAVTLDRFADGTGPGRSYIGAGDLARVLPALTTLPASSLPAILNVAAPDPVAMEGLARAAGKALRWRPAPASATQTVTMDTALMTSLLPSITPCSDPQTLITRWQYNADH